MIPSQPAPLRSFLDAKTDRDLILTVLALEDYIPNLGFIVHITPLNDAGLLLWDTPSTAKLREVNDLPQRGLHFWRTSHWNSKCIRGVESRKLDFPHSRVSIVSLDLVPPKAGDH